MEVNEGRSYSFYQFKPEWLPFNDSAHRLTDHYIAALRLPATGPKAEKYQLCVASFLYTAQRVIESGPTNTFLGVRFKKDAWSVYPMVGRTIGIRVADAFVRYLKLKKIQGSGSSNLQFDEEEGRYLTNPIMSLFSLTDKEFVPDFYAARFVQVGLPWVKVNKAEARQQSFARKADKKSKPSLSPSVMSAKFGEALRASERAVDSLNEFWRDHPIVLPNGHAGASAKRVFHDSSLKSGGRFYGLWTGQDKDDVRLKATIDNEPVCELDINASQPTLLSCLLGERLGGLKKGDKWTDVYGELSKLITTNIDWTKHDGLIDVIDLMKRNRKVAKSVIMEVIGLGASTKSRASIALKSDYGLTQKGWEHFLELLVRTVPALERLENRYNRAGELTGYINGAGFLSYHESEIMLRTLTNLMKLNIPAYPVHDCLMVKVTHSKTAASVYRETTREYCYKMSGLDVLIPLSCEIDSNTPKEHLPNPTELIGVYLN